jgi:hypothetical protein
MKPCRLLQQHHEAHEGVLISIAGGTLVGHAREHARLGSATLRARQNMLATSCDPMYLRKRGSTLKRMTSFHPM